MKLLVDRLNNNRKIRTSIYIISKLKNSKKYAGIKQLSYNKTSKPVGQCVSESGDILHIRIPKLAGKKIVNKKNIKSN